LVESKFPFALRFPIADGLRETNSQQLRVPWTSETIDVPPDIRIFVENADRVPNMGHVVDEL
jgi:hypothetical protein